MVLEMVIKKFRTHRPTEFVIAVDLGGFSYGT